MHVRPSDITIIGVVTSKPVGVGVEGMAFAVSSMIAAEFVPCT